MEPLVPADGAYVKNGNKEKQEVLKEFKQFALRGNVMDLAVGIIIGSAFGRIVSSFVGDILMPPIGLAMGNVDFSNLFVDLSGKGIQTLAAAQAAGVPTLNYGIFMNSVLNFLMVAFAIYLLVKQINRATAEPAPARPSTKGCPYCYSRIPLAAVRCGFCTSQLKP